MPSFRFRFLLPLLALGGVVFYVACSDETTDFKFATADRGITLPADHAAHPDFQNEWWYYTGQLRAKDGRRFGFQLTWFRIGLGKEQQEQSKFKASTLYFAHFTITDKQNRTFRFKEMISRGGAYDDAGADSRLLRTWIGDWRTELLGNMFYISGRTDSMALSLIATPRKPAVLQGANGYSRKGKDPGNATMYYSLPRLSVAGVLQLDDELLEVEGTAWMDHEFGTSQLDAGQVGWDWFALQLDNGEEVMLYGLRRTDGSFDPNAVGIYVQKDGQKTSLASNAYSIEVLERWTSPASGATYPAKWKLTIPSQNFTATVTPYLADQELRTENSTRITYWEGAVQVDAERAGQPVNGEGYVELTGYAKPLSF